MANKVKWARSVADRHNNLTYTSKDGRFTIKRREYVLPFKSVGYKLLDRDKLVHEHDTLRDAKEEAQELLADENSKAATALMLGKPDAIEAFMQEVEELDERWNNDMKGRP